MRVTMILPALTEATSPLFRPIKYSLFPPLGLATLAGYLDPDDEVTLLDEHVERVDIEALDSPDLLVVQPYITSARRSYEIADHFRARGVHVAMGGLHVTSLPDEAAAHADTIFTGPGEDTWRLRHLAYAGGWKKFEPAWDALIRSRNVVRAMPMLERTLAAFGGGQAHG